MCTAVRMHDKSCSHAHSAAAGDDGDAVIVCGSTVDQVKANVDACADNTPLPQVGWRFLFFVLWLHLLHH